MFVIVDVIVSVAVIATVCGGGIVIVIVCA